MSERRDPIVEAVRQDLLDRSQVGLAKYGVGLDRTDLTLRDWLQHAYEETLDKANYLKRTILELDQGAAAGSAEAVGDSVLLTLGAAGQALRSYQHGNASPDLAREIADAVEALIGRLDDRAEGR